MANTEKYDGILNSNTYDPTSWEDNGGYAINADRLNNIEQGIANLSGSQNTDSVINKIVDALNTLDTDIVSESTTRSKEDTNIRSSLASEIESREEADNGIIETLYDASTETAFTETNTVRGVLNIETEKRVSEDNTIKSWLHSITDENKFTETNTVRKVIDDEIKNRNKADTALESLIHSDNEENFSSSKTVRSELNALKEYVGTIEKDLTDEEKQKITTVIKYIDYLYDLTVESLDNHTSDKNNPHNITKATINLEHVDNMSYTTIKKNIKNELKTDLKGEIKSDNDLFITGDQIVTELKQYYKLGDDGKLQLPENVITTDNIANNLPNSVITKDNITDNLPSNLVTNDNIKDSLDSYIDANVVKYDDDFVIYCGNANITE